MKGATINYYHERMLKVLVYIQQNLEKELSLVELAGVAHFSPYHFHRIFKGMTGESVKSHIRRLRLEKAAHNLKCGNEQITNIAFSAGYETHEAFTRAFKDMFGKSPSTYRQENGYRVASNMAVDIHYQQNSIELLDSNSMQNKGEKMQVKCKYIPCQRVAFIRHIGPYNKCGETWSKLCTILGSKGYLGSDAKFIGLCHDDPEITEPEKIRYDACISVDESFKPEGKVGVQIIEDGEYAVATHFGPYERLNETYVRLMGQWLPQSGRILRSLPCFEIYLNDPESTEPEDLLTDIYIPLQ